MLLAPSLSFLYTNCIIERIVRRVEETSGGTPPTLKSKAEKSGLGTEVTKNRIKNNAAAKIAIIRQQELKQIQKERLSNIRSYDDGDLNSVFDSSPALALPSKDHDDELSKNTLPKYPTRITDTDIKNIRQQAAKLASNFSSPLPGRPVYKSTYKFPVLSNKPTVIPSPSIVPKNNQVSSVHLETDAVQKLLKDNEDPFKKRDSILENNDIINNNNDKASAVTGKEVENDGHFTLINLHNDRVKIVQDFDDESTTSPIVPEVEEPRPLSQSYLASPSFSDLDHGDSTLLFLGSSNNNDHALVNKTLPGLVIMKSRSQESEFPPRSSTAASTNFIRVVQVKSSPLSLSPVPNNNNVDASSPSSSNASSLSSNKTNDSNLLLLPYYIKPSNNNPVSRQNLSSINNETSSAAAAAANYVASVLIGGASINKSGAGNAVFNKDKNVATAEKTLSMFVARKNSEKEVKGDVSSYSSGFNVTSYYSSSKKYRKKESYGINNGNKFGWKSVVIERELGNKIGNGSQSSVTTGPGSPESSTKKMTNNKGVRPRGVVSRVHAHVSHCPKLKAPAEIICDIHIRERHDHPNPQLVSLVRNLFY